MYFIGAKITPAERKPNKPAEIKAMSFYSLNSTVQVGKIGHFKCSKLPSPFIPISTNQLAVLLPEC